jgi:glycosyltransferase involved in cell wall biosynthesis
MLDEHCESKPKVSVIIITFNQLEFIRQALEGALMQETSFLYEIVVGDDCSTDGTTEILLECQRQHPERLRVLIREQNLGLDGKNNFAQTLNECRGEYIAILEGDDFWTSPSKLQIQTDFLDTHPEFSFCFHPVQVVDEKGTPLDLVLDSPYAKALVTLADLAEEYFIPTGSSMFRASLLKKGYPEWYYKQKGADWTIHVLLAEQGLGGRIEGIMGAYRVHPDGLWSKTPSDERGLAYIQTYEAINRHLGFAYNQRIKRRISREWFMLAGVYFLKREWAIAAKALARSLILSPFNPLIPRWQLFVRLCERASRRAR